MMASSLLHAAPLLKHSSSFLNPRLPSLPHWRSPSLPASLSSSISVSDPTDSALVNGGNMPSTDLLACPICLEPLLRSGPAGYTRVAITASSFKCRQCKKIYASNRVYLDLTLTAGFNSYQETMPLSTEIFRNPVVSFVYEKGWRQSFSAIGYPGPDEELKMAEQYLKPVEGGVLVDVSCASGVLSRRFIRSGLYSAVIALDFSEEMLNQFHEIIKQEKFLRTANLTLVRADVARLPFATGAIDGIHAGAAMHCWPFPTNAVAEISRILKPGGIFVASTNAVNILNPPKKVLRQIYGGPITWDENELEEICNACGLISFSKTRRGSFIMFSVMKPV